jgi:hypothetical protein
VFITNRRNLPLFLSSTESASDQNGTCVEVESASSTSCTKKIHIKEVVPDRFFIETKLETLAFGTTVTTLLKAFPHQTVIALAIYEGHHTCLAAFYRTTDPWSPLLSVPKFEENQPPSHALLWLPMPPEDPLGRFPVLRHAHRKKNPRE